MICLLLLLAPAGASASDQVFSRAFFEDKSSRLSLSDIQTKPLTSFTGPLSRGYTASTIWIRLGVLGNSHPEKLIVRIEPSYLDEIALFTQSQGDEQPQLAGDLFAPSPKDYISLNHNFVIEQALEPQIVWIRLHTTSSSLIHIQVFPFAQALRKDRLQDLLSGIFIGALVLYFAWGATQWWMNKERLTGALAINQLFSLLYSLAFLGYFRVWFSEYLQPNLIDVMTSFLVISSSSVFIWFHKDFLQEFQPSHSMVKILNFMLFLYPVELTLFALDRVRIGLQINMVVVFFVPIVLVAMAYSGKAWQSAQTESATPLISKKTLMAFYGSITAVLWVAALPLLNITPSSELSLITLPLFGFFCGLISVLMLQLRTRKIMRASYEFDTRLQLSRQEVLHEKSKREEQKKFIGMLTHELKTPLAVLLVAIKTKAPSNELQQRASRAISDMNGVIERCALVGRLDDGDLERKNQVIDIADAVKSAFGDFDTHRFAFHADLAHPHIQTDKQLLLVILKNLLENAVKYSIDDSPIQVSVLSNPQNGRLCVSVENQPNDAGHPDPRMVFSKYYRSAGAHESTGSGLGLHLCQHIAKYLDAELHYIPMPDKVRFELCLPR